METTGAQITIVQSTNVNKMKKILLLMLTAVIIFTAAGCSKSNSEVTGNMGYTSITMDKAKEIFETDGDYIILDVRRPDEFSEGHIPNAVNIPNETINSEPPKELPDLNKKIYVYCRSGRRSKQAAEKLAAMGYTDIVEFGGILDWSGEIQK